MLYHIFVLLCKELRMIVKDKRGRMILVMPILVQTVLFGYVATHDVNNITYALLDNDRSLTSRTLAQRFAAAPNFIHKYTLENNMEIAHALDTKSVHMVLHIPPQFERRIHAGQSVAVQVLVDGRNSNVAGAVGGYSTAIIEAFNTARLKQSGGSENITLSTRAWFNSNLQTRWSILPTLMAILAVVQVMMLAGQSVAREKEQGTLDQLMVTPLNSIAIMIGKTIPPILVGLMQSSLILLISLHWFAIPFAGSFVLLYAGLLIFNCAIVGIGLCISVLTNTLQQALLFTFSGIMPMILLSGFATPITTMPEALQTVTLLNPVRYGVEMTQRIYLEGAGFAQISHLFWPLGCIAIVTMSMTVWLFRRHLN